LATIGIALEEHHGVNFKALGIVLVVLYVIGTVK
jgi:hypothetical protein